MANANPFRIGVVWRGDAEARRNATPQNNRFFRVFEELAAIGVDAQKAACKKIETVLNDEVPIALPYWYNFLGASSKAFTGIYTSALGQMFLSTASKVA